jgi:hypothetical protein
MLRSATLDSENWIARSGYLLDKRPSQQYGIPYDKLIDAIRAQIPAEVESIWAKVTSISARAERQKLVLSNGEEISAPFVVLANGLNVGLRRWLGIERRIVSACHSVLAIASPAKIAAFYDDPVKTECDAWSVSIDTGIYWRAQRSARFPAWFGDGILRRLSHRRRRASRSIIVVVVAVILIGRIMRLVALIVPELSIDAVGGQQFGMRTAFDRQAA